MRKAPGKLVCKKAWPVGVKGQLRPLTLAL